MSDRDLDLILHLRALVALVADIGGATIDDFVVVEVERHLEAMRPPPPAWATPGAESDDLPF